MRAAVVGAVGGFLSTASFIACVWIGSSRTKWWRTWFLPGRSYRILSSRSVGSSIHILIICMSSARTFGFRQFGALLKRGLCLFLCFLIRVLTLMHSKGLVERGHPTYWCAVTHTWFCSSPVSPTAKAACYWCWECYDGSFTVALAAGSPVHPDLTAFHWLPLGKTPWMAIELASSLSPTGGGGGL